MVGGIRGVASGIRRKTEPGAGCVENGGGVTGKRERDQARFDSYVGRGRPPLRIGCVGNTEVWVDHLRVSWEAYTVGVQSRSHTEQSEKLCSTYPV